ncbi:MAG: SUMF1/EgtB/PvdO family nonheme iron enzyme [Cyanobacteria bacterium P01_C01_bin.89]
MAWTRKDKKEFRKALQGVYRDYGRLKIFVAEEMGWQLEDIVASGQPMITVGFELLEWAEGQHALQELYEAFREENPNHPFKLKTPAKPQPSAQPAPLPTPAPEQPAAAEIKQEHQSSGDNVAGNKYVYYTAPPPDPAPVPEPVHTPEPAPAPKPALPGEPFTFTTASVTPDGKVTKRQGEGRRQIFDLGGTPLEMVWIPPGDFLMGSPNGEGEDDEKPQHRVTFAEGFWMGRYPVTQAQWKWVAGLNTVNDKLNADPAKFKGVNRPVEQVSGDDAQEFCRRLSKRLSQVFKLPSEAQWEYACRAGTTTPYAFGKTLTSDLAHYGKWFAGTVDVGKFSANPWGLHDTHGNVWEWCEDTWHGSYKEAPTGGSSWIDNKSKTWLLRGGSWLDAPGGCRSACRYSGSRDDRYDFIGFRVACSPQD